VRVLVCGGTGFIGSALVRALLARGDDVLVISRKQQVRPFRTDGQAAPATDATPSFGTWKEWKDEPDRWQPIDAIVNLSGESINQRWTPDAKRRIVDSRMQAATTIADIMRRMSTPPPVVVNASGISLYGHSVGAGSPRFDENAPGKPADFLGETVIQWEAAADQIPAQRLVKLRIGLVIARSGGAFPLLRLPYLLMVGGRIGSGQQGLPWIHLSDMVGLILFSLDCPQVQGPLNAVAPDPVTNDAFGRALAEALGRPHWLPVPGALLRLLLGEMSTLVLTGQLAMPRKALDLGYSFAFPKLEDALRDIVG